MAANAMHSSLSSLYYTPPEVVEPVRDFLGTIRLDPASDLFGQKIVKAQVFMDEAIDGLIQAWGAQWFNNPPYSDKGGALPWVMKAIREGRAGHEGIQLLNATPDREWFKALWGEGLVCFLDKRIHFLETASQREERWKKKHGEKPCPPYKGEMIGGLLRASSPTHGNALVYFGERRTEFVKAFSSMGQCVGPIGPKRESR